MKQEIKIYRHSLRNVPEQPYKPYVPNYQSLGLAPDEHFVEANSLLTEDIKLSPRPTINNQPYAEAVMSPIGKSPVPNIGNNMEHTWSSVDGEIIDDLKLDASAVMIDNNEFITEDALKTSQIEPKQIIDNELISVINDLEESLYVLLLNGNAICSGPMPEIEEQVRAMVFGEHSLCEGKYISIENIVVLKKVKIKVGVFLE